MENLKSKNRPKLTRELLLQSPEFWIENIRTELFNMVQEYLDENEMSRKQLADKLGVSKGYISQVLNGESDHRLSKIVSLATALGKAPYLYLKDLNEVLVNDINKKSVYIDFKVLESKAKRCDILGSFAISNNNWNLNRNHKYKDLDIKLASKKLSKKIFNVEQTFILKQGEKTENIDTTESFGNAA